MSSNGLPRVKPVPNYRAKPDEHVALVVNTRPGGKIAWVKAYQATIDFFGWADEFQSKVQYTAENSFDGRVQFRKRRHRFGVKGTGMMIYRVRDRHRPGPQGRHRFSVANCFGLYDTAELAHFTKGDWYWMTSPDGVLRSREEWEAIYQTGGKVTPG